MPDSMTQILSSGPTGMKVNIAVLGDGFADGANQTLYNNKVNNFWLARGDGWAPEGSEGFVCVPGPSPPFFSCRSSSMTPSAQGHHVTTGLPDA